MLNRPALFRVERIEIIEAGEHESNLCDGEPHTSLFWFCSQWVNGLLADHTSCARSASRPAATLSRDTVSAPCVSSATALAVRAMPRRAAQAARPPSVLSTS